MEYFDQDQCNLDKVISLEVNILFQPKYREIEFYKLIILTKQIIVHNSSVLEFNKWLPFLEFVIYTIIRGSLFPPRILKLMTLSVINYMNVIMKFNLKLNINNKLRPLQTLKSFNLK